MLMAALIKAWPKIPTCNLTNWKLVVADLQKAVKEGVDEKEVVRFLNQRLPVFGSRNLSSIPPMLFQRPWESTDAYISRCYNVGGYRTPELNHD